MFDKTLIVVPESSSQSVRIYLCDLVFLLWACP